MQLKSNSIVDGAAIAAEFALGKPGEPVTLAANRSPHLAWSDAPEGTRSFVLSCIDVDVPTRPDDVNQADREVPPDLPRGEFVHWLMIDIPVECGELSAGSCSEGVVPHGKQEPFGPPGARQARNDYSGWFAGDPDMAGDWFGYDGPCPPWNDSLVHHYRFLIQAVDLARLPVADDFDLAAVRAALAGHVLAEAELTGTYTLNKRLARA